MAAAHPSTEYIWLRHIPQQKSSCEADNCLSTKNKIPSQIVPIRYTPAIASSNIDIQVQKYYFIIAATFEANIRDFERINTMNDSRRLHNIYICFPGGKHKVLTMSYDDGRLEDRRLVSIFNEYGIRGTFNVNSGLDQDQRIPLSEYRTLYEGHEVACHTHTHPTIARCPMEEVVAQILEDRKILEDTMGYPVRGLAYPNGSYSQEIINVLPALGIRYARTVTSTMGFSVPENFLAWDATCHHNRNLLELGRQFVDLHKTQYLYMMYVWGHSYEFTGADNWSLIEDFCRLAGGHDDIWYATNIEIVDYLDDAKRLQYTASGNMVYNPNFGSVWLEADGEKIEVPGGQTAVLFEDPVIG